MPCSAAERADVALRADRRVRVEHLLLLVVGQLARDVARAAERIVERRELLDEARPALEQLGELLGASAAAVARACVRRDRAAGRGRGRRRARPRARRA